MAWSEHIHVHVHNDDSEKIIRLLKEIKEILATGGDNRVKELEMQMDSWLATLKTEFTKLETVAGQVDSTK